MREILLHKPFFLACVLLILGSALHADEPPLPEGLGSGPAAAEEEKSSEEPALPEGLGEGTAPEKVEKEGSERLPALPFDLNGFWEARVGSRTQHDTREKHLSLAETRLQIAVEKPWSAATLNLTGDFLYDPILDDHKVDLERGDGWFDLREANVSFTPVGFADVKAGRQILTWGTGDLLFINDLFPKDWNAFFIGRDQSYLKAPSDAVKVSLFSGAANLDVVYSPRLDADRFIDGRRLSYYDAALGRRAGRNAPVQPEWPDHWLTHDELAARLFKNVRGYELALYGYGGFWKSPGGMNPVSGRATFPELAVYGASVRGNAGPGIGNVEIGYYDSLDDGGGRNPFVRNGEFRALVGYEQEVATDFTAGVQWYLERMTDYGDYRRNLPPGSKAADEDRHVLTLRLTKLLLSQNLKLSLFSYYSPTDNDAYLRPNIHYKVDDHWSVEIGGNLFVGEAEHTFFGQFSNNTNVYAGARYGF